MNSARMFDFTWICIWTFSPDPAKTLGPAILSISPALRINYISNIKALGSKQRNWKNNTLLLLIFIYPTPVQRIFIFPVNSTTPQGK